MAEEDRATLGAAADPAAAADQAQQAPPDPATETTAPPPDGGTAYSEKAARHRMYRLNREQRERLQRYTEEQLATITAAFDLKLSQFREALTEVVEDPDGNKRRVWYSSTSPINGALNNAEQMAERIAERIESRPEETQQDKAITVDGQEVAVNTSISPSTSIFDIFREFMTAEEAEAELDYITRSALIQLFLEVTEQDQKAQQAPPKEEEKRFSLQVSKRPQEVSFPIDKVTSALFRWPEEMDGKGQKIDMLGKHGKGPLAILCVDLSELEESGLKITRQIDEYDERVYMAVSSLYRYQGDVMTVDQIYYAMGYDSVPNATQRKKINDSLTKMSFAHLFIDNQDEADQLQGRQHYRYDAALLPMERCTVDVNGHKSQTGIHLFREPPATTFAIGRNQYTTANRRILQTGLSATPINLKLESYLRRWAARQRNGSMDNKKVTFAHIFEVCGIKSKSDKSRVKNDRIPKIMEALTAGGLIGSHDYKLTANGIEYTGTPIKKAAQISKD